MCTRFDNKNLFESYLKSGINLFLGAGFSVLAKNKENQDLPIGNQLANELMQKFDLQGEFSLPQVATILENTRREEFYNYLKRRFEIGNFDKRYLYISNLKIKSIYTTNIDNLVFEIFKNNENKYCSYSGRQNNIIVCISNIYKMRRILNFDRHVL